MKRLPFLFACIVVFTAANIFSVYGAEIKIGIIDPQKIIMQSEKINKYREDFKKEIEGKKQEFIKKQSEVQALENELKTKGNSMTTEDYREKADTFRRESRDLKRMQEDLDAELKAKEAEIMRKFSLQVKDVVNEFLKKEKYTLILEKSFVLASDDAVDITDQIMKLYDSKP